MSETVALTWRHSAEPYAGRHKMLAVVTCPNCKKEWILSGKIHTVSNNGVITPSVVCPVQDCGFHEWCYLPDWKFPEWFTEQMMSNMFPSEETDTREIAEKIARAHTGGPYFRNERIAKLTVAIDEALRNERERCAKIADKWANARSCTMHDNDPCCHIRTGAAVAAAIRKPKGE